MKSILTGIFLALAAPALAQQCGTEASVKGGLTYKYGETVIEEETRQAENGSVIQWQIWLNDETGSWSLTGTLNDSTCLMAAGEDYQGQVISDFLDGEAA